MCHSAGTAAGELTAGSCVGIRIMYQLYCDLKTCLITCLMGMGGIHDNLERDFASADHPDLMEKLS